MSDYAIGFDVGGSRLKAGAVDRRGKVLAQSVTPSHAQRKTRHLLTALAEQVERLSAQLKRRPVAIGLGLCGAVEPGYGPVLLPGKFNGLEGFPLVPKLRAKVKVPVIADNDARVSMLAEHRYGAAKKHDWAVLVTIGTGVGSGVVLDGRILRDPHLQFGTQLSHIVMQTQDGRRCLMGPRGTGEMLCSATALAMSVRDGIQRGLPSTLAEQYWRDPQAVDFAAVIEAASERDALCTDELQRWTTNLGWLLISAAHVYAPEVIILGGGGSHAAMHFLKPLREHVNAHVFRHPRGEPIAIVPSKLGDMAGVIGAATLAWEHVA